MIMKWKKIPPTTKNQYISGLEALNVISSDGITIADWHPLNYWMYTEKLPEIPLYLSHSLLGECGIKKRVISFDPSREVYIADYPRAIADFVLHHSMSDAKQMVGCRHDFLSTEQEENELYSYLKNIQTIKEIGWFIHREYPEKYLEDEIWTAN